MTHAPRGRVAWAWPSVPMLSLTVLSLTMLFLTMLSLTVLLGALSTPARAAGSSGISVELDTMTPVVPTKDATLTMSGEVINAGPATVTNVQVQLRRSGSPLRTRQDVAAVVAADVSPSSGSPDGYSVYSTRQLVAASLPPGQRRPFTIQIPFKQLGLSAAGTYVIGVEVLGRESGVDSTDVRKADLRTFVPWFPEPGSVKPVDLVWLWPLSDWPARTPSGVLLNNRTPTELSPGGRLEQLVQLGARFHTSVSWILDPALLQTASDMTRGYQVQRGDTVTVGNHQDDARAWLDLLKDAVDPGDPRSMPYADIDAAAVVRAGMSNDVVRAVTQGPGIAAAALKTPAPGGVYWAPFGRLDRSSTNVLASAGVTTVVLADTALPATDPAQSTEGLATTALPTSVGTMRAVLTDSGLTRLLGKPQGTPNDVLLLRQQFLAETALVATTLPADQTDRTLVVAPASVRWAPNFTLLAPLLRATRSAPWLSPQSLAELLDSPVASTSRQRGGYGTKARAAELSPGYMAAVKRIAKQLDSFTAIVDDPTGVSEPYSAAILRSESAAWRTGTETGEELVAATASELSQRMSGVRVLSEGTITFSGDTGRVPVTITNDLDRSVTVGLALQGDPALRLESEPLSDIRIEAGKKASVDIDARVIGGDPLTVKVQLLTPDLTTYGKPARIELVSTAYSRAAAWVVAAAFLAIVVFVVVGVARRIHKASVAARQSASVGTGPGNDSSSGTVEP